MPSAFRTADLILYHQYTRTFPQLLALPEFTAMSSGHFNSEKLIALKSDVIIVAVGTYRAISVNGVLDLLTKANIPVVVFDLSIDPLNNTPISTSIMGNMLGNIQQSQAMNQFREKQLSYISQELRKKSHLNALMCYLNALRVLHRNVASHMAMAAWDKCYKMQVVKT